MENRKDLSYRIQALTEEIDQIEQSFDLSRRSKEESDDEIGGLAKSLNKLLGRLEIAQAGLETAKRQSERAVLAKSMFVANMSHEIRTPLHGVLGTIELAFQARPHPSVARYLSLAKSSAESLLDIVNHVLDYSKIEAGKLELDPCEVYLPDLIKSVWSAVGFSANEKDLELLCCVSSDVPLEFVQDRIRLQQIITNLVGNAIKFTKHGSVTLKISTFEKIENRTVLYVTVEDTGEGIPEEKQVTLFDAFVQADAGVSRRHGGTGLGLAISKQLIELMGGEIWLQSEAGKGTIFHMMIPVETTLTTTKFAHQVCITNVKFESSLKSKSLVMQTLEGIGWRFACEDSNSFGVTVVDGYRSLFMNEAGREQLTKLRCESGYPVVVLCPVGEVAALEQELLALDVVIVPKPYTPWDLEKVALSIITGEDDSESERKPEPKKLSLPQLKVLVVDDIYVNCLVAQRILEAEGLKVQAAKSGEEALNLLEKAGNFSELSNTGAFDLVLLDVQMPGLDGLETTKIIRQKEKQSGNLPVIALSAHVGSEARERFLEAGMNAAVSKPFKLEDLLSCIIDLTKDRKVKEVKIKKELPQKPIISPSVNDSRLPINFPQLMDKFSHDTEIVLEILEAFAEEQPMLMKRLENGLTVGDPIEVQKASHAIKGSAASICAENLHAMAGQVEAKLKAISASGNKEIAQDIYLQAKLLLDLAGFTYSEIRRYISLQKPALNQAQSQPPSPIS